MILPAYPVGNPLMHPDQIAILVLLSYAAITIGVIAWQIHRNQAGWLVWCLYAIDRIYVGLLFRWRSNRRSTIPQSGPALIIANHRSPVDPHILWMNHHLSGPPGRIRVISFLVAREYYDVAATHWICRAMQSIPVGRDGRDMGPAREALRRLQAGHLVGIFPEGKINTGPSGASLLPGDTGIAWLALRAQVPVYPIYIQNAPSTPNMIAPFITPTRVRVCFGEPIDLSGYANRRNSREVLQDVTNLMMARLEEAGRDTGTATTVSNSEESESILPLHRAAN